MKDEKQDQAPEWDVACTFGGGEPGQCVPWRTTFVFAVLEYVAEQRMNRCSEAAVEEVEKFLFEFLEGRELRSLAHYRTYNIRNVASLQTLRAFLDWCVEKGYCETNPISEGPMANEDRVEGLRLRRMSTFAEMRILISRLNQRKDLPHDVAAAVRRIGYL